MKNKIFIKCLGEIVIVPEPQKYRLFILKETYSDTV